jgi:hypothetical protein
MLQVQFPAPLVVCTWRNIGGKEGVARGPGDAGRVIRYDLLQVHAGMCVASQPHAPFRVPYLIHHAVFFLFCFISEPYIKTRIGLG